MVDFAQLDPNSEAYPRQSTVINGAPAGFMLPYKLGSGVMRGTQIFASKSNSKITIGAIPATTTFGIQLQASSNKASITLDADSNAFYVTAADGSKIGMGEIPDGSGDFGFFSLDSSGFLLYKIVGSTQYWYDKIYNKNIGQAGLLPDGNYAWIFVPPSHDVKDAFST